MIEWMRGRGAKLVSTAERAIESKQAAQINHRDCANCLFGLLECPDLASGHHRIMEPHNGALVMMVLSKGFYRVILDTRIVNVQQRRGKGWPAGV